MNDANIIAVVSIVAGASVTIMSGWFQYRSTRTAQRQDRILSYENRIGERRISAYLDTLRVVLPIKGWLQEYLAGSISVPPTLEIDQELLVSLAAFGSGYVESAVVKMAKDLRSLSGFLEPIAEIAKELGGKRSLKEFETEFAQSAPEAYALWMSFTSGVDLMIKILNIEINDLEQIIRGEVQDVPVPSTKFKETVTILRMVRGLRRVNREFPHLSKSFRDSTISSEADDSSKGKQPPPDGNASAG
jgi:hypothetical protein